MVVSLTALGVDESLFFLSWFVIEFAFLSSNLVLVSPDGDIELFKPGPIGSKSSLHGFAFRSNSCLSVAYPRSTYKMDVCEKEGERFPL